MITYEGDEHVKKSVLLKESSTKYYSNLKGKHKFTWCKYSSSTIVTQRDFTPWFFRRKMSCKLKNEEYGDKEFTFVRSTNDKTEWVEIKYLYFYSSYNPIRVKLVPTVPVIL